MYVKQVIVEGILTYKETTALDYFDPKVRRFPRLDPRSSRLASQAFLPAT